MARKAKGHTVTDLERWRDEMLPTPMRQIDLTQWAQEFRDVYTIAEALCKTPFVPREMIGQQASVAAAIMKGRELGLDPFDALGSIYIVHGKVGFYAEFMRRRIVQAGHILNIVESTETRCIIEGTRKDTGQKHRAQFTAEQARKAGIDLGKYPADKLIARATSRLCTQAFPDVLSGTLIAEDLIDGVIPADTDQPAPAEQLERPAVQRRRPTKPAKATRTQPKPMPAASPTETDDELAELLGDTPTPQPAAPEPELLPVHSDAAPHTAPEGEGGDRPPPHDDHGVGQPPPDPPATAPQNRRMHAIFRQLGLTDRTDRLTVTSHILGYPLTTSAGLTRNEATQLLDQLETWQIHNEADERINDILNTAALAEAQQDEQDTTDGL